MLVFPVHLLQRNCSIQLLRLKSEMAGLRILLTFFWKATQKIENIWHNWLKIG